MAFLRLRMLVGAVLVVVSTPFIAASNECLVTRYAELTDPASVNILSHINLHDNLVFVVEFDNMDVMYNRDSVELTNAIVSNSMVRDGESVVTKHDLPLVIPEGWTTLRLQLEDTHFELSLLTGQGEEANLLDLPLDFPARSVHVQGHFALCDGESPEWEVKEGEEVPVQLPPRGSHKLQVTSPGFAAPYLMVPSDVSPHTPQAITPNATLSIATRWKNTVSVMQVSQEDGVQVMEVTQSIASSMVVVGSRLGMLHLRLHLSPPPSPLPQQPHNHIAAPMAVPNPPPESTCHDPSTHPHTHTHQDCMFCWPVALGAFAGGMLVGLLLQVAWNSMTRLRRTEEQYMETVTLVQEKPKVAV